MGIFVGRDYEAKGSADARALRWKYACYVQGTAKRPTQLFIYMLNINFFPSTLPSGYFFLSFFFKLLCARHYDKCWG